MRQSPGGLILSATDVSNSLACRQLTGLDMSVALGARKRPFRPDPLRDLLIARGLAHEKEYVDWLKGLGRDVLDLHVIKDPEEAASATLDAMRAGQDVIVQAALRDGRWFGLPDVLLKTRGPGTWAWSYEAVDTKLSQETRGGTMLQLGLYCELLRVAQGVEPEHFRVVTPRSGHGGEVYRTADYAAYVRLIRGQLEATVAEGADAVIARSYPEPVDHCEVCAWFHGCDTKRRADDHLSLVAGASRSQRRELTENGIAALTSLARCEGFAFKLKRGAAETLLRVRDQAKVQFASRGLATPLHELRPVVKDQGLVRLPEPNPGDVFLDLEGDPFAVEGGREYLFGIVKVDATGAPQYRAWWAMTHAEEGEAFRSVIDFIEARRAQHPAMHVYHYAPYEPSAFGRLMGRHATRSEEVDALFRGGHFIDLYGVVRQALLAGVERYSIKNLEPLYGFVREVPLESARSGLRAMERGLETGVADIPLEVRGVVEGYNKDDCVSTLRLRDWLEGLRAAEIARGVELPRPAPEESKPSEKVDERAKRVKDLRGKLLVGISEERAKRSPEQQARWLLAYMLDWHRREDKAAWWEHFRLKDLPEEDLFEERQAVAGLEFVKTVEIIRKTPKGKEKKAVLYRYGYPPQEMEMRRGDDLKSKDGKDLGKLVAVHRSERTIDIDVNADPGDQHPSSAFAHTYVNSAPMEKALGRIADGVLRDGGVVVGAGKENPVARHLLLAGSPRVRSGSFRKGSGETDVAFAVRVAADLDESVLAIQGPPGAGKTYAGAQMICDLVKRGKRVGVIATSHKVIRILLREVVTASAENPIRVAHLPSKSDPGDVSPGIENVADNGPARQALKTGQARVLGGTSWMWAREEFAKSVDVLFVDEAGQMSLANVLAASQAASSVVLLGDPQQLEQPIKGAHPEGVDASALGHMLGESLTIPADRGIFLPVTWRLAPPIAKFTSELFYEGRLDSKPGLENQKLTGTGDLGLDGSGLWLCAVDHDGNRNWSQEEIDAIAALLSRLTDGTVEWTNEKGKAARVIGDDVLVVAPYNAQVSRLVERLAPTGARVGTVDKFQGQEAPVVIYSMATSRPEDVPRGMEFLYSLNRLNVATSRARCAAILVASPRLFEPECRTPKQMRLANALCRFREIAKPTRS